MTHRLVHTAALLALAAISTCASAQTVLQTDPPGQVEATGNGIMETEPPGRVGRISLVQGQVEIGGDVGAESSAAVVNWPVTTRNLVTTSPGARTEIRIGSTSIRLDGDSSLEFTELDDDRLRLRLHFGSASIRVMNSEVAPEFELRTAQATVRLTQPGRLRVDADRVPDTSLVSVLDGEAQVDGAGASLTVRAGRSAEVRDEDVSTRQARRDEFDDWALTRDQALVAGQSSRHIGTEMTGYEELDRYGSWSTHSDYGSLWTPTVVASDWTPYRDGQWSYIAPWGWTWVDNAPWGYAPFHYGRWVQVRNRWAWAPGRLERRPVWSPALVGWVGGGNWSVGFASHDLHAHGWYPLSPYDRYVPGYRLSSERLRRLNDWRHATRRAAQQRPGHQGLTVVPREHFGGRGPVVVPRAPRPDRANFALPRGPGSAPPPPLVARADWNRGNNERRDLLERREVRQRLETGQVTRDGFVQDRGRLETDPMARQRESNERLSRERLQQQERVVRQQEERDRMQRDLDNRMQADRMSFGRHAEREREQRERMRERAERGQQLQQQRPPAMAPTPAPAFSRPESRPEPRPMPRPDVRPPPHMVAAPPPRPAPPPQMVAPTAPRPQPSAPAFTPRGGGEQRAHTDARGRQIQER